VPDYSDGKVLQHIFKADTAAAKTQPIFAPVKGLEKKQLTSLIDDLDI
jgi:hypothetical protein